MTKTGTTFDGEVDKLVDRIVEFGNKSGDMADVFNKRLAEVSSNLPEPSRASRGKAVKSLKNLIKVYKDFIEFSVGTLSRIDSFLLEIKGLHDRAPDESKPELVELFSEVESHKSIILEAKLNAEKEVYETDLVMRKIKRR